MNSKGEGTEMPLTIPSLSAPDTLSSFQFSNLTSGKVRTQKTQIQGPFRTGCLVFVRNSSLTRTK